MKCPKCNATSGDDWSQCQGSCPMPMSPYYDKRHLVKIRIKQVPDTEPNAEGEWIFRDVSEEFLSNRLNLWRRLDALCAPGHHHVSYERVKQEITGDPSPPMQAFMLNDVTADSSADAGGTAVLAVLSDSQGNSQIIDLVPKEEKP